MPVGTPVVSPKPAPTESKVVILDATHRCDACGSQAYVRVLTTKGVFEFCGHHFTFHEYALAPYITADILDERWRLFEVAKLDVSA